MSSNGGVSIHSLAAVVQLIMNYLRIPLSYFRIFYEGFSLTNYLIIYNLVSFIQSEFLTNWLYDYVSLLIHFIQIEFFIEIYQQLLSFRFFRRGFRIRRIRTFLQFFQLLVQCFFRTKYFRLNIKGASFSWIVCLK